MSLSAIGCGHLGVVDAACIADIAQNVLGVNIDEVKAEILNPGKAWSREPGRDEILISRSLRAARRLYELQAQDARRLPNRKSQMTEFGAGRRGW